MQSKQSDVIEGEGGEVAVYNRGSGSLFEVVTFEPRPEW